MVYLLGVIFSVLIGIGIGTILMYYRDRNLLKNYKILYNELKHNKIKLHEYQKRLGNHFTDNIGLLNRIAENYRDLYQNMIQNASFFLPNTYNKNDLDSFHIQNEHKTKDEHFPVEVPRDYSEDIESFQKDTK